MQVPDKPTLDGLEAKWGERWEADGTYRFDRTKTRDEIYAIDTPPPTVSGSLHLGHVESYTHTDLMARFKRMRGLEVFYPIGWDDNGLPTERRVQNYFGVVCDPTLPNDEGFDPNAFEPNTGAPKALSRGNFIQLCERLTAEDERAFEDLFRRLGASVDWTHVYTTIGEQGRSSDAVGHRLPDGRRPGRDRGPRGRRSVSPHRLRPRRWVGNDRDRNVATGADPCVRRAGRAP
jgi:valyl-tRNA synthetase